MATVIYACPNCGDLEFQRNPDDVYICTKCGWTQETTPTPYDVPESFDDGAPTVEPEPEPKVAPSTQPSWMKPNISTDEDRTDINEDPGEGSPVNPS